ncbi:MAG: sensor histidine kinase [Caldilineaceae bacterium]
MFRHLHTRLLLSHTLPILVFVPLLAVVLLYQLERHYFLDELAKELVTQATLIADFTSQSAQLWEDPATATQLVQRLDPRTSASIMLLSTKAHLLAANLPQEQAKIGQLISEQIITDALGGTPVWTVNYRNELHERVIDVAIPVFSGQGQIEGVVRLSHSLTDIQDRMRSLRWPVLITLFTGATLALLIGLVLAQSLAAPLIDMTKGVARFNPGKPPEALPEYGPKELQTLAATYNRQNQRLYELERTRKLLLSGIVHELGRPLGAMKAAAQTIGKSHDLALAQELAGGIDEQIAELSVQLDELALLGEVELKGLHLVREPIELAALLEAQHQQFEHLATHHGLTFRYDCPPELPTLQGDRQRIGQIIGNLLHNACKYTPTGGQIVLTAHVEEGPPLTKQVVISVTDNGPGIPLAEQAQIFQFFYRSPSLSRVHQGMGIGLALARYLAEAHGGALTVESQLGAGATFKLHLPIPMTPLNPED